MPFAVQGQCYATPAEALAGFQLLYPMFGDANYVAHSASSITASGLLSYTVLQRPITGNTVTSRTGTMQLTQCTVSEVPFDPVAASGIFVFFFASVVSLWFLSKNIGTILQAVKRF